MEPQINGAMGHHYFGQHNVFTTQKPTDESLLPSPPLPSPSSSLSDEGRDDRSTSHPSRSIARITSRSVSRAKMIWRFLFVAPSLIERDDRYTRDSPGR